MNNSKIWILLTGVVVIASGLFIYSITKAKETERVAFDSKIQELQLQVAQIGILQTQLENLKKEKSELETRAQAELAALEEQVSDFKKNEAVLRSKIDSLTREKESLAKFMENNNVIVGKLQKKIDALEAERRGLIQDAAKKPSMPTAFVDPMAATDVSDQPYIPERGSKLVGDAVVDLGRIIIRQSTQEPATVEHINTLYGFIVLSAGTQDGLRKDSIINITRNNRLIAKAVVKKVREEASSAVTLPEWTREEIRIGDQISVNSATTSVNSPAALPAR